MPAMIDNEPTLNKHTRQAFKADAISKRKAHVEARKKAQVITVSRSAEPQRQAVIFEATAYVALCDTGCTGITRTGVDVRNTITYAGHRVIAVDPRVIPLDSLVRVNLADGTTFTATAQDTGGRIHGHIVDILVSSESDAWAFGRQRITIEVLRKGNG